MLYPVPCKGGCERQKHDKGQRCSRIGAIILVNSTDDAIWYCNCDHLHHNTGNPNPLNDNEAKFACLKGVIMQDAPRQTDTGQGFPTAPQLPEDCYERFNKRFNDSVRWIACPEQCKSGRSPCGLEKTTECSITVRSRAL
jgi:hypothetical protein